MYEEGGIDIYSTVLDHIQQSELLLGALLSSVALMIYWMYDKNTDILSLESYSCLKHFR